MANNSDVLHPIQEVPLLYKRLFKRELDFNDMLEMLPMILRQTGSIATATYLFQGTLGEVNEFCLELPCNVFAIDSVSHQVPIEHYRNGLYPPQNILLNYNVAHLQDEDEQVEDIKVVVHEINREVVTKPVGALIDFKVVGNNISIHCNYNNLPVDVIYVGTVVDEDGYPMVPYKTIVAIAHFMHHVEISAAYFAKQADLNMYQVATKSMNDSIANARTPDWMNQNQTNQLLNVLTNSNRKQHNRSLRG